MSLTMTFWIVSMLVAAATGACLGGLIVAFLCVRREERAEEDRALDRLSRQARWPQ